MSTIEYRESEPFTAAAVGPLTSWRRHWVLGLVAALLGAALGAGAAYVLPVTYTAEARVAVGAGDLTSGAIAGFPTAASQLASNYARYVNDRGVAGTDVPENVTLSASQIPESNVIRVEAESTDPDAARDAANQAAQALIDTVNDSGKTSADAVYAEFSKAAKEDAAAQTELREAQTTLDKLLGQDDPSRAKLRAARAGLTEATATADNTTLTLNALRQKYTNLITGSSTAANLLLVRSSDDLTSNRTSLLARLGLAGLAVGAAVGLVLAVAIERRRARRRGPSGTGGEAANRDEQKSSERLGV